MASTPGVIPVKLDVTDPSSLAVVAKLYGDVTLLINNAGISGSNAGALDTDLISSAQRLFEPTSTASSEPPRAFAHTISHNGGGAIVNVLFGLN
jgi:short-subunit dehydrogenase